MCLYWQIRRNHSSDVLLLFHTWPRMDGDWDRLWCLPCTTAYSFSLIRSRLFRCIFGAKDGSGAATAGYFLSAQSAVGPSHPPKTKLRTEEIERQVAKNQEERQAAAGLTVDSAVPNVNWCERGQMSLSNHNIQMFTDFALPAHPLILLAQDAAREDQSSQLFYQQQQEKHFRPELFRIKALLRTLLDIYYQIKKCISYHVDTAPHLHRQYIQSSAPLLGWHVCL